MARALSVKHLGSVRFSITLTAPRCDSRARACPCDGCCARRWRTGGLLTVYSVNSLLDVVAADTLITLREALEAANTNAAVHDAPAWQRDRDRLHHVRRELVHRRHESRARHDHLPPGNGQLRDYHRHGRRPRNPRSGGGVAHDRRESAEPCVLCCQKRRSESVRNGNRRWIRRFRRRGRRQRRWRRDLEPGAR